MGNFVVGSVRDGYCFVAVEFLCVFFSKKITVGILNRFMSTLYRGSCSFFDMRVIFIIVTMIASSFHFYSKTVERK